jgi:hypothetical protein
MNKRPAGLNLVQIFAHLLWPKLMDWGQIEFKIAPSSEGSGLRYYMSTYIYIYL